MKTELNEMNQPVGPMVVDWNEPRFPSREAMIGCYCRLEPIDAKRHAASLFANNTLDVEGRNWTYLPYGPFDNLSDYQAWIDRDCCGTDPLFFAIIDLVKDEAVGVASYLRINAGSGSIEVGHINYSPRLQRTPAGSEAMFLMMQLAFDLGYRRYEWKCDALNAPSRCAAQRLGFSFEGVFRQATVTKGRNRDTAWYSVVDVEWAALREAFLLWLSPTNFDEKGIQRERLSALTSPLLNRTIREAAFSK